MIVRKLIALALAAAPLATASPVSAQECGDGCSFCANGNGYAGFMPNPNGLYNRVCYEEIPFCVACPPDLVADLPPAEGSVLELLAAADVSSLERLVLRYRERLLVSTARNVLVFRGSSCSPQAMTAASFVRPERAAALARLGVRSLEEFLSPPNGTH